MCGRYYLTSNTSVIAERAHARALPQAEQDSYRPSYNVAPTRVQPVVRQDPDSGERQLHMMKWGLIPSWTKEAPDMGSMMRTMNARDDSLKEGKPMFRKLRDRRRIVVPINGFYEWQKMANGKKQPYLIRSKEQESDVGGMLFLAGLYDTWHDKKKETKVDSFTIVTTSPIKTFSWLHNRMPVILDTDEAVALWLDPKRPFQDVVPLLDPKESLTLTFTPVSSFVGKVGNDDETCIQPVKLEATTSPKSQKTKITAFFGASPERAKGTKQEENVTTKEEEVSTKDRKHKREELVKKELKRIKHEEPLENSH